MEIIKTSFTFHEGEIENYNIITEDAKLLLVMHEVKAILRPAIELNRLSGKIILTILNTRIRLSYENIIPYEFTPVLMDLITSAN